MLLILVGMMMYELLRNMWGFDKPINTGPSSIPGSWT